MKPRLTNIYKEVLGITNDIPRPRKSKIYGIETRYNETSSYRTYIVSPRPFVISRFHCIGCIVTVHSLQGSLDDVIRQLMTGTIFKILIELTGIKKQPKSQLACDKQAKFSLTPDSWPQLQKAYEKKSLR